MELRTQGAMKMNRFQRNLQTNQMKLGIKNSRDKKNPEAYLDIKEREYWNRLPEQEKQQILLRAEDEKRCQAGFGTSFSQKEAPAPYPYRLLEKQQRNRQRKIQETGSVPARKKTGYRKQEVLGGEPTWYSQTKQEPEKKNNPRNVAVFETFQKMEQRSLEKSRKFSQEKGTGYVSDVQGSRKEPEKLRSPEAFLSPHLSSEKSGNDTKTHTFSKAAAADTKKTEQVRQAAVHTGQAAEGAREAAATAASGGTSMAVDVAKKAAGIVKNNFRAAMYKEEEQRKVSCEAIVSEEGQAVAKISENKIQRAVTAMVAMVTVVIQSMFAVLLPGLVILGVLLSVVTGILSFIFGGASTSGYAQANVSEACERYRPLVEQYAAQYGMEDYVELILAVMMQESGGLLPDVMQAAEGAFNTKYPHVPNGIPDPEYSIECGVQELKYALDKAGCTGPTDLEKIKLALQGYNYGSGYIDWAMSHYGGYSEANAAEFSDMMAAKMGWSAYGDKKYVEHVLRYYHVVSGGFAETPEGGMRIPLYDQKDYANVAYGGGSIASSGCGPTSFAMVASYLLDREITPVDAIWCGNAYYVPGAGTSWSYFQGAADHFGIRLVGTTTDPNTVMQALSEGKPVISSQRPGLFTSGGHFIVLRGITADGKILVNDPNDSPSKNYVNRQFDMMREIHATSACYWIFDR